MIKNHPNFRTFNDISFLKKLTAEEAKTIDGIFDRINTPNNLSEDKVRSVQPWVQRVYKELAKIWNLVVNLDSRRGGAKGQRYADHYLTYKTWSKLCCKDREDKGGWSNAHQSEALVQCHRYSDLFFRDVHNRTHKYVSIITDGRNYKLWYTYWDPIKRLMGGPTVKTYPWNQNTLQILGCVFKTFALSNIGNLRANASPQDLGNISSGKDISNPNPFLDLRSLNQGLYNVILEWVDKRSPSGLPIVTKSIGDVEARRILGTGFISVVFEAITTDNIQVALKYSIDERLKREAQMLKKFKELKDIPELIYEDFDSSIPYIVTSMVGEKINAINIRPSATSSLISYKF